MKTSEQKFIRLSFPLVILMFTRTVPGFDPDKNPYVLAQDAGESPKPRLTRSSRKLLKLALSNKLCPKILCLKKKHMINTIGSPLDLPKKGAISISIVTTICILGTMKIPGAMVESLSAMPYAKKSKFRKTVRLRRCL